MAKTEKWVLKGDKMMCPKCGGVGELSRNEYVAVNALITVNVLGQWDWVGESEVLWDTQDYHKEYGESEWRCGKCDIDFSAPNVKSAFDAMMETQGATENNP